MNGDLVVLIDADNVPQVYQTFLDEVSDGNRHLQTHLAMFGQITKSAAEECFRNVLVQCKSHQHYSYTARENALIMAMIDAAVDIYIRKCKMDYGFYLPGFQRFPVKLALLREAGDVVRIGAEKPQAFRCNTDTFRIAGDHITD